MGQTAQPNTATPQDIEEATIHRIAAPLIAQGWRKRDALRRAAEELGIVPTRPSPYSRLRDPRDDHTDTPLVLLTRSDRQARRADNEIREARR
jgi:hypothetical protein